MSKRLIARILLLVVSAVIGGTLGGALAARPRTRQQQAVAVAGPRARLLQPGEPMMGLPPGIPTFVATSQIDLDAAHNKVVQDGLKFRGHSIGHNPKVIDVDQETEAELNRTYNQANLIPQVRVQRFSKAFENQPDWVLTGWAGEIVQLDGVPGGYVVALKVSPQIVDRKGGTVFLFDFWIEHHFVDTTSRTVKLLQTEEDKTGAPRGGWMAL